METYRNKQKRDGGNNKKENAVAAVESLLE
jgi:hypothetical protein